MLQSEHYELKLVEGSDIVNPLVIDRPNYEAIDNIMYGNESQAIGNATELKSGTIHALTRSKGNQRYFCFTATSNYEAGDTFTVDSVPVTALMANGTALPDMAYVVNGTVLCSLVGTLLTVYTVGSALADDSLKLGGELPAYYAKQSDLTATDTLARGASTLSLSNEQAIREINSNLMGKLVWENSAPASAFSSQSIIITNDKPIKYFLGIADSVTNCFKVGTSGEWVQVSMGISSGKIVRRNRSVSISVSGNDYRVSINNCTRYDFNSYGSVGTSSTENDSLIPIALYALY